MVKWIMKIDVLEQSKMLVMMCTYTWKQLFLAKYFSVHLRMGLHIMGLI